MYIILGYGICTSKFHGLLGTAEKVGYDTSSSVGLGSSGSIGLNLGSLGTGLGISGTTVLGSSCTSGLSSSGKEGFCSSGTFWFWIIIVKLKFNKSKVNHIVYKFEFRY